MKGNEFEGNALDPRLLAGKTASQKVAKLLGGFSKNIPS